MEDYPEYRATREEADELLASLRLGRLIATGSDGWPQIVPAPRFLPSACGGSKYRWERVTPESPP